MIPDQMTKCQVTGVFIHVDNICIGSEQCRNEAVYAFDTKEIGVRMVYRCDDHTELDGPAFGHQWERVPDEELVMEVIDS